MIFSRTISLHYWSKLIVFSFCLVFNGCRQPHKDSSHAISIIWNGSRAVAISIPLDLINDVPRDSIREKIIVQRSPGEKNEGIPGEYEIKDDHLLFAPLLPFTRGLRYRIKFNNKSISEIAIPRASDAPEVLAVYPRMDSLPENLLKFYIQFSKPMAEGYALEFVSLRNAKGDSLKKIFLDLKPELWNEDGTLLTLWMDPGRIKRDLQPNKLLGPPLKNGEHYTLLISPNWPDQEGGLLTKPFSKNIQAIVRDSISPSLEQWNFKVPNASTRHAFEINFYEPLDYFLAKHTIHLLDKHDNSISGTVDISDDQRKFFFIPKSPWASGRYRIEVENILEDLAGNNLNRPFDRDLSDKNVKTNSGKIFQREFIIR
jgi:hypothetical protein